VNFLGACTQEPNLALVMELMGGGSLLNLLADTEIELPWSIRLDMVEDIACGIQVLHSNKPLVLHRDLKSGNILIGQHYQCKLTDFGISSFKTNLTTTAQHLKD